MSLIIQIPPSSAQKTPEVAYFVVDDIYNKIQSSVDEAISHIFTQSTFITETFAPIITVAAGIYIALMGYGIISGYIVVNGKEAAVRFSKVILILILTNFFMNYSGNLYHAAWDIPLDIADHLAANFHSSSSYNLSLIHI